MQFEQTDGGLIVPKPQPEQESVDESEFPVKAGWHFSMCDERYHKSGDEDFRMQALEALYIAVDPGGGRVHDGIERRLRMVHELAVELVGGVPESWKQYP